MFAKLSIGFFLLRLIRVKTQRYIIYFALLVNTLFSIAYFFLVLFQCFSVSIYVSGIFWVKRNIWDNWLTIQFSTVACCRARREMHAKGHFYNSFILPLGNSGIDGSSLRSFAGHHSKPKFEMAANTGQKSLGLGSADELGNEILGRWPSEHRSFVSDESQQSQVRR
jgi:hypothetical protein